MKISVIIPYYNADRWIGRCLDSIMQQDLADDDYEIIVVNDGSKEEPVTLLQYADKYPQVKVIHQKNARQGAARNNGMRHAHGDYIMFCDSDDFLRPHVLGRLYDLAVSNDLDVAFYDMKRLDENEQADFDSDVRDFSLSQIVTGIEYLNNPPKDDGRSSCQFLLKRSVIEQNGLSFHVEKIVREDSVFYTDTLLVSKRVAFIDVAFYYYVQNQESVVHKIGKKQLAQDYAGCFFWFIEYLMKKTEEHEVLRERFAKWSNLDAFYLLHNVFRFCPVRTTKEYVHKLKAVKAYPLDAGRFQGKNNFLCKLMNCYPVWITLCRIYHILPERVRHRIF